MLVLDHWPCSNSVPGLPPITGKIALGKYVAGGFRIPDFKINWISSAASISRDAKLAYLLATTQSR